MKKSSVQINEKRPTTLPATLIIKLPSSMQSHLVPTFRYYFFSPLLQGNDVRQTLQSVPADVAIQGLEVVAMLHSVTPPLLADL